MKPRFRAINIYLLAVVLMGLAATGCSSNKRQEEDLKKSAVVRLHLEVNKDVVRRSQEIPIIRSHPVVINVADDFIVPEYYLEQAKLVETVGGGFAISLIYDQQGAWTLQNVTSVNIGKRVAVFAAFYPDVRWLAAPKLDKPITDGVFSFVPDASLEEARRIVDGVNYSIAQRKKESLLD